MRLERRGNGTRISWPERLLSFHRVGSEWPDTRAQEGLTRSGHFIYSEARAKLARPNRVIIESVRAASERAITGARRFCPLRGAPFH